MFEPSAPTVTVTSSTSSYKPRPSMAPQPKFTSNMPNTATQKTAAAAQNRSLYNTPLGQTGSAARSASPYNAGKYPTPSAYGRTRSQTTTKSNSSAGKILFIIILIIIVFNVGSSIIQNIYDNDDYDFTDDMSFLPSSEGFSGWDCDVYPYGEPYTNSYMNLSVADTMPPDSDEYPAEDGYTPIEVVAVVEYTSDSQAGLYLHNSDFELYTDDGIPCEDITSESLQMANTDAVSQMKSGDKQSIFLVYNVPDDSTAASLLYTGGTMNDTPGEMRLY